MEIKDEWISNNNEHTIFEIEDYDEDMVKARENNVDIFWDKVNEKIYKRMKKNNVDFATVIDYTYSRANNHLGYAIAIQDDKMRIIY